MILSSVGQNAGIGFAIPINTAKAVLNDLMDTWPRAFVPPWECAPFPSARSWPTKWDCRLITVLLIVQVDPGGSADQAGLRGGTERAYLGNTPIMLGGDLILPLS